MRIVVLIFVSLFVVTEFDGRCAPSGGATLAESAAPQAKAAPEQDVDFLTSLKEPVSWASWGAELRSRFENGQNHYYLQDHQPDSEYSYIRLRPRIWTDIRPVTNLTLNARFMSEPRYYFHPNSREGWANDEGLFDSLHVDLDNIAGQPIRVRAGRQEIAFGDKWVIFDGTPADGSRTEFFDAARLTVGLGEKKGTLDLMGIQINAEANEFLPVVNSRNDALAEQDERAGVAYLSYELAPSLRTDGYYIYRHLSKQLASGDDGNLHLVGARFSGKFSEAWEYVMEGAPEFGDKNGHDVFAYGFQGRITRDLGGSWKHSVHVGYEQLSGDDPRTDDDEGWDPVWSRRARWSELMVYTIGAETRGRKGYWTNLQRPYAGWSAKPTGRLQLQADYMPMFAIENPRPNPDMFSEDGKFRGQLIQAIARYKFTEHLSGHLWAELFFPGDYYQPDHRDTATFFRAELMFSL